MTVVKMHEAKTKLSRLIQEMERGEEIVIARGSKCVAKLVPVEDSKPKRTPGFLKGRMQVSADFDAPLPEDLLNEFGV